MWHGLDRVEHTALGTARTLEQVAHVDPEWWPTRA